MDADDGDGDGLCFPYDVLLNILRRLTPRTLARCSRACRAWRATIDDNLLLGPPHFTRCGFHGFFLNKTGYYSYCSFFAPLKAAFPRIVYLDEATVRHSCNGLLLVQDTIRGLYLVYNPVTTRYARLPSPPRRCGIAAMSLAFDPVVSLEYDVFLLHDDMLAGPVHPSVKQPQEEGVEEPKGKMVPLVDYSSRTERWENREFLPGLCAPGHFYDVVATPRTYYDGMVLSSEYWLGSFYMHCHHDVLMILRPSKGTYDMIMLPGETSPNCIYELPQAVLATCDRGIHYATFTIMDLQLKLWMLTESTNGQLDWTLAHDTSLKQHHNMIQSLTIRPKVTWGVEEEEEEGAGTDGSEYSWNSDEDNFIDAIEGATQLEPQGWGHEYRVVGFHPHKNAIILVLASVVAVYHINTTRIQYLGDWYELIKDPVQMACMINNSFTYRPCYEDVLRTGKLSDLPRLK